MARLPVRVNPWFRAKSISPMLMLGTVRLGAVRVMDWVIKGSTACAWTAAQVMDSDGQ